MRGHESLPRNSKEAWVSRQTAEGPQGVGSRVWTQTSYPRDPWPRDVREPLAKGSRQPHTFPTGPAHQEAAATGQQGAGSVHGNRHASHRRGRGLLRARVRSHIAVRPCTILSEGSRSLLFLGLLFVDRMGRLACREGPPGGILQGRPCVIYCALGALVPPLDSHVDLEASSYSLTRLHWRESVTGGHTSGSAATRGARPTASRPRAACSGRRQDPEEAGPHRLLGFPESHSSGYKMTSRLHRDLPA